MYSRNTFGCYYPITSSIHKLNPVLKLFLFLLAIILMILSSSLEIITFLLLLVFIMMLMSFVPFKYYLNAIWSLRYILILIAFICAYFRLNITETIVYLEKLIILVEYLNILAFTTSPSESVYGIERFLSLFNIFFLRLSGVAVKINNMIRYVPFFLSVEYKTLKSCASRGFDYYRANIIDRFFMFFKIYPNIRRLVNLKFKEVALCSELKLYNIRKYRTNYRVNRVGLFDMLLLIFHLMLIYAYLVDGGML